MPHVASVLLLALAAQATAEEKVQVPYRDILACAQAANCTNMTKSGITWYDQVGLAVITFEEDGRKYALKSTGTRLSVWLTVPGDRAPSRLVSLDSNGALRSGELGPQTADSGPRRRTPDEMAAWRQTHKVFNSGVDRPGAGVLGEEFRPFWQALADQALAAIRRQMSK